MSEDKSAYKHEGEVKGFGSEKDPHPSTEHRDTAHTDGTSGEDRNELMPERRSGEEPFGPRTGRDSKIARKDES